MSPPVLSSVPFLPASVATPDVVTELTTFELMLLTAYQGLQNPQLIAEGTQVTTGSLAYKMPIAVGSAVFRLMTGGIRYRRLGHLMLPITPKTYSDGVAAEVLQIQSNSWTGWGDQPQSMADGASLIGEAALAAALESGDTDPSVENYIDGDTGNTSIKIFDVDKPVDPLGGNSQTYSNKATGSGDANGKFAAADINLADNDRIWSDIKSIKAQDGVNYRDLEWFMSIVPQVNELKARRYWEDQGTANDYIIETSGTSTAQVNKPNVSKQRKIKVVSSPYLTKTDRYYAVCRTRTQRKAPWVELTQVPAKIPPLVGMVPTGLGQLNGAGLEIIIDGLDSEGYKHGTDSIPIGHVGVAAKRRVGVGILAPWQIFEIITT